MSIAGLARIGSGPRSLHACPRETTPTTTFDNFFSHQQSVKGLSIRGLATPAPRQPSDQAASLFNHVTRRSDLFLFYPLLPDSALLILLLLLPPLPPSPPPPPDTRTAERSCNSNSSSCCCPASILIPLLVSFLSLPSASPASRYCCSSSSCRCRDRLKPARAAHFLRVSSRVYAWAANHTGVLFLSPPLPGIRRFSSCRMHSCSPSTLLTKHPHRRQSPDLFLLLPHHTHCPRAPSHPLSPAAAAAAALPHHTQ